MSTPITIIGLGGSQSNQSSSLFGLRVALQAADKLGAQTHLISLADLEIPLYHSGRRHQTPPAPAQQLAELVAGAQAMIWSSPLYHGSVSAAFKNAIDWLELLHDHDPPYLTNKAIGLMASSGGNHAMQAINTMEYIVRALRGHTVPYVLPLHRSRGLFGDDGQPLEPATTHRLELLGTETYNLAKTLHATKT